MPDRRTRLAGDPDPRLRGARIGTDGEEERPGRSSTPAIPGRGTGANPANRFESLHYVMDATDAEASAIAEAVRPDADGPAPSGPPLPRTLYLRDPSRRLITRNDSPDVPFDASINPYRGCEHGCIYCYARPTHEYLGFSAGLDFETRILVKEDAPALLRNELASKRWTPTVLALSGVTDPYQPIERHIRLTRRCLEVLLEFRNPVGIITKNALVARDIDLFGRLAAMEAISVGVSITTLDAELHRVMEPRASAPHERLRAVERLAAAGVPVHVMVAPVIPGLTDHEIPRILEAAASAGASRASFIVVRLPHAVAPLFEDWLARHHPDRRGKVLARLRSMRRGRLNDPAFGTRMRGEGAFADQIAELFRISARRHGLDAPARPLSTAHFQRPGGPQLELFG
jgi:DNA repair photolyase